MQCPPGVPRRGPDKNRRTDGQTRYVRSVGVVNNFTRRCRARPGLQGGAATATGEMRGYLSYERSLESWKRSEAGGSRSIRLPELTPGPSTLVKFVYEALTFLSSVVYHMILVWDMSALWLLYSLYRRQIEID